LIKKQNQKTKLASEFAKVAGQEGVSQLSEIPNGQHALAVVNDHVEGEEQDLMRQMYQEQENMAVDYTLKEKGDGYTNKKPSGPDANKTGLCGLVRFGI
jgi:hypothetical protein